jgi:hypothetical protein
MKPGKRLAWTVLSVAAAFAALYLVLLGARPVLTDIEPFVFTPGESIRLRGKISAGNRAAAGFSWTGTN